MKVRSAILAAARSDFKIVPRARMLGERSAHADRCQGVPAPTPGLLCRMNLLRGLDRVSFV